MLLLSRPRFTPSDLVVSCIDAIDILVQSVWKEEYKHTTKRLSVDIHYTFIADI